MYVYVCAPLLSPNSIFESLTYHDAKTDFFHRQKKKPLAFIAHSRYFSKDDLEPEAYLGNKDDHLSRFLPTLNALRGSPIFLGHCSEARLVLAR